MEAQNGRLGMYIHIYKWYMLCGIGDRVGRKHNQPKLSTAPPPYCSACTLPGAEEAFGTCKVCKALVIVMRRWYFWRAKIARGRLCKVVRVKEEQTGFGE